MYKKFKNLDPIVINLFNTIYMPLARISLFVVYFWFGFLKVIDKSPASGLVQLLSERTVPLISFDTFIVWFGVFECVIGILFLIKGLERLAIFLLFVHMATTFMPVLVVPQAVWSGFMVPTLEGQYIIKNLLIISAAIGIGSRLRI